MAQGEQPLIRHARRLGAAFQINPAATDRRELASASSFDLAATASSPTHNKPYELLYRSLDAKLVVGIPFKDLETAASILASTELEKVGLQSRASCSIHGLVVLSIRRCANAKSMIGDLAEHEDNDGSSSAMANCARFTRLRGLVSSVCGQWL
ncbi:uncharacterized protein [Aegilops tauschii subsp. strangulata]|uniref:uncharacterized protein n=1 Tax=Aegilops tauschii subsp. strangulata TaxID=200361 RepID=UPI003CC8B83C